MTTWICTRQNELTHHGIKGQKWGVRRFQNKDGSLTPAGKRRYDEPNVGRKSSESVTIDGQTFKVYGRNNKQYADKVAKKTKGMGATVSRESKVKEKKQKTYKIPENKSLHRLKLEEKYMKNGMTREQAEQAAAKRIRTEQFVAVAAGVTVASAVAYAKYKGYTKEYIFKEGSEFQRIMKLSPNAEIKDGRQYLSFDKNDKIKYKGLLGGFFEKQITSEYEFAKRLNPDAVKDKVYDVTVKNKNEIRVASEKMARDTFQKLYREDMQFRTGVNSAFKDQGYKFALGKLNLQRIANKVDNGGKLNDIELKRSAYDLFNVMLMDKTEQGNKNSNKFYDALRKQGVNALIDVNDKKYSGYKSKMPIITLDDGFEYSKRVMESKEIADNFKKGWAKILIPQLMQTGAIFVGAKAVTPVMNKARIDKAILNYKAEHPNTKMTDSEIKEMVIKQLEEENKSKE